jgi:hypothetical protein
MRLPWNFLEILCKEGENSRKVLAQGPRLRSPSTEDGAISERSPKGRASRNLMALTSHNTYLRGTFSGPTQTHQKQGQA